MILKDIRDILNNRNRKLHKQVNIGIMIKGTIEDNIDKFDTLEFEASNSVLVNKKINKMFHKYF